MLFEESRSVRSFVGRVEAGDDIVEALTLLCDVNDLTSALVRLSGTVRDVELVHFDATSQTYATSVDAKGPFYVVQSTGQMAKLGDQPVLRIDALLAIHGPIGQQLVFGQLRRAAAVDCEFVVETFDDLSIERRLEASSGRFPIAAIRREAGAAPAAEAAPAPPRERRVPETISEPAGTARPKPAEDAGAEKSDLSWADAMEASKEMKPASRTGKLPVNRPHEERSAEEIYSGLDDDDDEPSLRPGDILDHPKLGECRVIRVEDEDYAHIRLSRGQIRKLALEVIELKFQGERDGKNVFKVRVRK